MKIKPSPAINTFIFLATAVGAVAEESDTAISDSIRKATLAYVEAFNRGDAIAVASSWSTDGSWSNPITGDMVSGRKNLEAGFKDYFEANQEAALKVLTHSVKPLSDTVAVEEGIAAVTRPGLTESITGYTAIHVLKNGKWLLERVIESDQPSGPAKESPLAKIDWLEGNWIDEDESTSISYHNEWIAAGRFMKRTFTVRIEGQIDLTGREIVGWNARDKSIQSWVFDSAGGFAELQWKKTEETPLRWVKIANGVQGSGETVSATHIMTRIDEDSYTFEAVGRERDGALLPNIPEVTIVRSSPAP